jgi:hypothetical protein
LSFSKSFEATCRYIYQTYCSVSILAVLSCSEVFAILICSLKVSYLHTCRRMTNSQNIAQCSACAQYRQPRLSWHISAEHWRSNIVWVSFMDDKTIAIKSNTCCRNIKFSMHNYCGNEDLYDSQLYNQSGKFVIIGQSNEDLCDSQLYNQSGTFVMFGQRNPRKFWWVTDIMCVGNSITEDYRNPHGSTNLRVNY